MPFGVNEVVVWWEVVCGGEGMELVGGSVVDVDCGEVGVLVMSIAVLKSW